MFFLQTYFRENYFAIIKSFRPKFLTKLLCKPFFKEIALRGNDFATIKNIGYHFHNHTFLLYTNFYQGRQCRSRVINKHTLYKFIGNFFLENGWTGWASSLFTTFFQSQGRLFQREKMYDEMILKQYNNFRPQ